VRGIDYQLLVSDNALHREFVSQLKVSAVRGTSNIRSCSVGPIDVDGLKLLLVEPAGNEPAPPDDAAGSAVPDLTIEDLTVTSTTLTVAGAASAMTSAAPYHSRETVDLPADENTELHVSMIEEKFQRCALIGASPMLQGRGHGRDIDSFDIVIRVNRVPTDEYYEDFGQRTDILYANAIAMYTGEVALMGNGDNVTTIDCGQNSTQCDYLAMVFRGDYGCDFEKLQKAWGEEAPFVLGCTTRNVTKAAYGFQLLESVEPTSGFMAFLTFAPLCHEFVLYGFAGNGTIDGHTLWQGHSLYYEHELLRWIEEGKWDKIQLPESREWLLKHLPAGPHGKPAVRVVQH